LEGEALQTSVTLHKPCRTYLWYDCPITLRRACGWSTSLRGAVWRGAVT